MPSPAADELAWRRVDLLAQADRRDEALAGVEAALEVDDDRLELNLLRKQNPWLRAPGVVCGWPGTARALSAWGG